MNDRIFEKFEAIAEDILSGKLDSQAVQELEEAIEKLDRDTSLNMPRLRVLALRNCKLAAAARGGVLSAKSHILPNDSGRARVYGKDGVKASLAAGAKAMDVSV